MAEEEANVFLENGGNTVADANAGVVILNVTLDELNNSNLSLTDNILLETSAADKKLEEDENLKLQKLLEDWNLLQLLPILTESGVTYKSLVYLSKDDIKEAIVDIGLRAELRSKLFNWRKVEHNIDDETITLNTKVGSWLEAINSPSTSKSTFLSCKTCKLSKSLVDLLKESNKGRSILEHYKNHSSLDKIHRDTLVSIILEDIQCNGFYLSPKDYPLILKEIESTFPAEKNFLEYYFFSRQKRKNPGGRLYNRYINSTTKIRKIENLSHTASSDAKSPNVPDDQEFDVVILNSIKTSLQRDFSNWTKVKDR